MYTLSYLARLVVYITVVAMIIIIVRLIFKHLGNTHEEAVEELAASETNRLLPKSTIPFTYGTLCDQEDLERGNNNGSTLYDGKICIICYNEERNCFFVPCGHCATCYICARRIIDVENKTCPVCRRFIHRVRKLFAS